MVFEGITGVYERIYFFDSKWEKKERQICEFEMDFKKSFFVAVLILKGQIWKRVWKNDIFWSEIGSGFGKPGGSPPPRIPKSTPRDEFSCWLYGCDILYCRNAFLVEMNHIEIHIEIFARRVSECSIKNLEFIHGQRLRLFASTVWGPVLGHFLYNV